MNYAGPPSKAPLFGETPLRRHIWVTFIVAAAAFMTAMLFISAAHGDRAGEGMVMIGLSLFAVPAAAVSGSLAFIFRRTVFADLCGGVVLFLTVFFGVVWMVN